MTWPFPNQPRPFEPAPVIPFDLDDVEDAPW